MSWQEVEALGVVGAAVTAAAALVVAIRANGHASRSAAAAERSAAAAEEALADAQDRQRLSIDVRSRVRNNRVEVEVANRGGAEIFVNELGFHIADTSWR